MNFNDFFNFDYAWKKFIWWIQNFDYTNLSNIIKIAIIIFIFLLIWKFLKNIIVALILAVLCFVVYETYFNVPSNTQIIQKDNTQVEIQHKNSNNKMEKLGQDLREFVNDALK